MTSRCQRTNLARHLEYGLECRVDLCSCGHVHLGIGPLTLRIEPEALRIIGAALSEANRRLDKTMGKCVANDQSLERDSLN